MKFIESIVGTFLSTVRQAGPIIGLIFILVTWVNITFLASNGVSTKAMLIVLLLIYLVMNLAALWHLIHSIYLLIKKGWWECRIPLNAFVLTYMFQSLGLTIDSSFMYIT